MNQLVTQVRTQQWITMVREQRNSGLTVKSWCKENHISENCFYYRQHRIRELIENEVPKFVEIHQPDVPTASRACSGKGTDFFCYIRDLKPESFNGPTMRMN